RLLHPLLRGAFTDLHAAVVDTIRDHRPAVILAGFGMIELVAPARAMLHGPESSGLRMNRGALQVAVSVRPDLRQRPLTRHERIVARGGAVTVDPHDLADAGREILHQGTLVHP